LQCCENVIGFLRHIGWAVMHPLKRLPAFVALIVLGLAALASPAAADDATTCANASGDVAIKACTRVIIAGGGNLSWAYYNRGSEYSDKGDYDRAISDYNEAIRINPKYVKAYNSRGQAYRHKGDNDRAISDCSEAIRIDPKYANAYSSRGLVFERLAEFEKARADFRAALGMPPKNANGKWAQDKARERLAALQNAPPSASAAVADTPHTATAVITSAAPLTTNDDRVALVIGNSNYEKVPALSNPERDAKLVADVLVRTGFKSVTLLINLKKDALVSALRNFAVQAETADWAVIYYAGHGMEVGGTNYLVPIDASIAADRDIDFEAVPLEQVLNAAERARKLRLVILDACRDNPFKAKMKRTLTVASRSVSGGLAAIEPEAGTLVVYAAKDGQQASDGDGIDSPFTLAFVKNVQTPGLEVRRLFDFVRDDVMDITKRQQQPFSYGSISGRQDFYFVATK
jgi:tetratricopeptide (TPR) repeat protein